MAFQFRLRNNSRNLLSHNLQYYTSGQNVFFFCFSRKLKKKKILKWPGTDFESYIKKHWMRKNVAESYMLYGKVSLQWLHGKKKTRLKSLTCSARLLDLIEKWDKLKKACAKKNSSNYLNFLRFVFWTKIR